MAQLWKEDQQLRAPQGSPVGAGWDKDRLRLARKGSGQTRHGTLRKGVFGQLLGPQFQKANEFKCGTGFCKR